MTEFKPDCTINLHVESRGKPARSAWACSLHHPKHGRLVLARKLSGAVEKADAEDEALLFALRQAARFLQEKIELNATFPLGGKLKDPLSAGRSKKAGANPEGRALGAREQRTADISRSWESFRLRRLAKMTGEEAKTLRDEVEKAFHLRVSK